MFNIYYFKLLLIGFCFIFDLLIIYEPFIYLCQYISSYITVYIRSLYTKIFHIYKKG